MNWPAAGIWLTGMKTPETKISGIRRPHTGDERDACNRDDAGWDTSAMETLKTGFKPENLHSGKEKVFSRPYITPNHAI
jgi:hypothetical protein